MLAELGQENKTDITGYLHTLVFGAISGVPGNLNNMVPDFLKKSLSSKITDSLKNNRSHIENFISATIGQAPATHVIDKATGKEAKIKQAKEDLMWRKLILISYKNMLENHKVHLEESRS